MSDRIKKINALISTELSTLILSHVSFKPGVFATISRAHTTSDLSKSTVYVQCFPSDEHDYILKTLQHEQYSLQKMLGERLVLKHIPRISFTHDTRGDDVDSIATALMRTEK